jgi:LacI family transcriptional regulator
MTTLSSSDAPEPTSRFTMRDVAQLSGVSVKTVSRVVNGERGVSPTLEERVQDAIRRLGYRRDLTASSLRRSDHKTLTIGLALEDLANPFSAALHRAVEDVARRFGVVVFAGSVDEDPGRERELTSAFLSRRVDGLLIVPATGDQSYLAADLRNGVPMVFADRPPRLLDADAVLSDNAAGAERGVRHLLERGHRRILFLGDLGTISTARERHQGFERALRSVDLEVDPGLVRTDLHTSDEAERAVLDRFATPEAAPTAIFASQNLITIGAMRALRRLGRQHSVALVGLDDFPLAADLDPGITVVAQNPTEMGHRAATLLFERLEGDASSTRREVLPMQIIERGSGEIPPPGHDVPSAR